MTVALGPTLATTVVVWSRATLRNIELDGVVGSPAVFGKVLRVLYGSAGDVFPEDADAGFATELSVDRSKSSEEGCDVLDEAGLLPPNSESVVTSRRAVVLARKAGCHQDCNVGAAFEDLPEDVGR